MQVSVNKMPGGSLEKITVAEGATIENVVEMSSYSREGMTLSLNGQRAELDTKVQDGDLVLLSAKDSGGK